MALYQLSDYSDSRTLHRPVLTPYSPLHLPLQKPKVRKDIPSGIPWNTHFLALPCRKILHSGRFTKPTPRHTTCDNSRHLPLRPGSSLSSLSVLDKRAGAVPSESSLINRERGERAMANFRFSAAATGRGVLASLRRRRRCLMAEIRYEKRHGTKERVRILTGLVFGVDAQIEIAAGWTDSLPWHKANDGLRYGGRQAAS